MKRTIESLNAMHGYELDEIVVHDIYEYESNPCYEWHPHYSDDLILANQVEDTVLGLGVDPYEYLMDVVWRGAEENYSLNLYRATARQRVTACLLALQDFREREEGK